VRLIFLRGDTRRKWIKRTLFYGAKERGDWGGTAHNFGNIKKIPFTWNSEAKKD